MKLPERLEHFCAYHDRCHEEDFQKLWSIKIALEEITHLQYLGVLRN